MDELATKTSIKEWILSKNTAYKAEDLTFETKILEQKVLSSLQVMDLIIFLQKLKGGKIRMENLRPGSFTDINTIYNAFLV